MNWTDRFSDLSFDQQPRRFSPRMVLMGGSALLYILGWRLITPQVLFWLGLLAALTLAWMASFGWREAVNRLIAWLERLERV